MSDALLIVDDSAHKIALEREMLAMMQWAGEIHTATTTEEAIRLIESHPDIHYAFIDYYIPSQNGPAVIASLKAKNPHARIALVSSAENEENFREARQSGAETCICTSWPSDLVEGTFRAMISAWQEDAKHRKKGHTEGA